MFFLSIKFLFVRLVQRVIKVVFFFQFIVLFRLKSLKQTVQCLLSKHALIVVSSNVFLKTIKRKQVCFASYIHLQNKHIIKNSKVPPKVSKLNPDAINIKLVNELSWSPRMIMARTSNYHMFIRIRVGIACHEYVLKFKIADIVMMR